MHTKQDIDKLAASHHLQILKDAGILKMRREATKNYYYFDPDMKSFELLISVLQKAVSITSELPDRSQHYLFVSKRQLFSYGSFTLLRRCP